MISGAEGDGVDAIHQDLQTVQIVHHGGVQGILAGEIADDARRAVAGTVDVGERAALSGFDTQLAEFTIEQQDVSDHQVRRIASHQRSESLGLDTTGRHGLFEQDGLPRGKQRFGHRDVVGVRAGDNPGLGS